MALKRKSVVEPIVITDSDNDGEGQGGLSISSSGPKKAKIDAVLMRKGIQQSTQSVSGEDAESDVFVLKADVHRSAEGTVQNSSTEDCAIVHVVQGDVLLPKPQDVQPMIWPGKIKVESEEQVTADSDGDCETIVISSADENDDDGSMLDESFSQNQEGSRRVRYFLHQQELGMECSVLK